MKFIMRNGPKGIVFEGWHRIWENDPGLLRDGWLGGWMDGLTHELYTVYVTPLPYYVRLQAPRMMTSNKKATDKSSCIICLRHRLQTQKLRFPPYWLVFCFCSQPPEA